MNVKRLMAVAAACALLPYCGASARSLHVPVAYGTIGGALQAAQDNDTVLVADGNYRGNGNVNLTISHRIVVMSEQGPGNCVIDGEGAQNIGGFKLATGSQIIGFTITAMTLNAILADHVNDWKIINCIILTNVNRASGWSVGIKDTVGTGGLIQHCIFEQNAAGSAGGGIWIKTNSSARVWDCLFDQNETIKFGAAIAITDGASSDIGNCMFLGNHSTIDGGAVALSQNSTATVHNCTFVNNTAGGGGGGLYKGSNSNPTVLDCIFWGNSGNPGTQLWQQNTGTGAGGTITINYCDVDGGINQQTDGWTGQHILNESPTWVDGRTPEWGLNFFYIDPESPCVDAGSKSAADAGMDTLFATPDLRYDRDVVDLGFHYDIDSYLRTGTIRGILTSAADGRPLVGATVKTSRRLQVATDENGYYNIPAQRIGDFSITFSMPGFLDSLMTDSLGENDTLHIDAALLHVEFTPSINGVDITLTQPVDTARITYTVANGGTGVLHYTVEPRLVGAADRDPWTLRESFNWMQTADDDHPNDDRLNGFVMADSLYYVAGTLSQNHNYIFTFNRQGALLDSFPEVDSSSYGYTQLAWDGEWLWGSENRALYAFGTNGEMMQTYQAPANPTKCIAWDPDRQILWMCGANLELVALNRFGEVQNINADIRAKTRSLSKAALFYWPDDPDGHPLYILHHPTPNLNNITKLNPDDADTMFVISLPENTVPYMSGQIVKYDIYSIVLMSIANVPAPSGNDRLDIYQLAGNTTWMHIAPRAGDIMPFGEQEFTLDLNMDGFPLRIPYEGQILYHHNAPDEEWSLPIIVQVNPNSVNGDQTPIPTELRISATYPNPFNGRAAINYSLPAAGHVEMGIYDLAGREVSRLADDWQPAGNHKIMLNADAWPSGVYIAKLASAGNTRTAKLVLMK